MRSTKISLLINETKRLEKLSNPRKVSSQVLSRLAKRKDGVGQAANAELARRKAAQPPKVSHTLSALEKAIGSRKGIDTSLAAQLKRAHPRSIQVAVNRAARAHKEKLAKERQYRALLRQKNKHKAELEQVRKDAYEKAKQELNATNTVSPPAKKPTKKAEARAEYKKVVGSEPHPRMTTKKIQNLTKVTKAVDARLEAKGKRKPRKPRQSASAKTLSLPAPSAASVPAVVPPPVPSVLPTQHLQPKEADYQLKPPPPFTDTYKIAKPEAKEYPAPPSNPPIWVQRARDMERLKQANLKDMEQEQGQGLFARLAGKQEAEEWTKWMRRQRKKRR